MRMRWHRLNFEHVAYTEFDTGGGKRRRMEWRAYRDGHGWALGLGIYADGKYIGKHLVIATARTFKEVKLMALSAAGQLYHEEGK